MSNYQRTNDAARVFMMDRYSRDLRRKRLKARERPSSLCTWLVIAIVWGVFMATILLWYTTKVPG